MPKDSMAEANEQLRAGRPDVEEPERRSAMEAEARELLTLQLTKARLEVDELRNKRAGDGAAAAMMLFFIAVVFLVCLSFISAVWLHHLYTFCFG